MANVSLPGEVITFDIVSQLGDESEEKGQYHEAKMLYLIALEGRRRVLGAEHKKILDSLKDMGVVLNIMKDY